MTINEAIEALIRLRDKYGNVEVYGDCEKCNHSTKFGVVQPQAHIAAESPRAGQEREP